MLQWRHSPLQKRVHVMPVATEPATCGAEAASGWSRLVTYGCVGYGVCVADKAGCGCCHCYLYGLLRVCVCVCVCVYVLQSGICWAWLCHVRELHAAAGEGRVCRECCQGTEVQPPFSCVCVQLHSSLTILQAWHGSHACLRFWWGVCRVQKLEP